MTNSDFYIKTNLSKLNFDEKVSLSLSNLPKDWQTKRIKFFLYALESGNRETGGGNQLDSGVFSIGGEHISWEGKLILDPPKYISEEFFYKLNSGKIKKDDVLLVKDGATIGKAALVSQPPFDQCAVNEHVFILRANNDTNSRFLYYLIVSNLGQSQILSLISGAAQPGLNSSFVNKTKFPYPPLPEQRAIADFLDQQTAKIDALIDKQERLIDLLEEKRNALISQAVTKGLDPDVPMKDSGVEWLGEIPKHWKIQKVKYGYDIQLGKMLQPLPKGSSDTLEPYLRTANVFWDDIDISDIKEMWFSPWEKEKYRLLFGDLVVCEGGDVARSSIWKEQLDVCYIQNAVHRVRAKNGYRNKYLYYWLYTLKNNGYIDLICRVYCKNQNFNNKIHMSYIQVDQRVNK
jgi:type I restriction enzyme S subunit